MEYSIKWPEAYAVAYQEALTAAEFLVIYIFRNM
jgi:hypothetical protein